jgi:hypothetical protein
MLIYCNGDSFTAGAELIDHLFDDFPGYTAERFLNLDENTWPQEIQNFLFKRRQSENHFINADILKLESTEITGITLSETRTPEYKMPFSVIVKDLEKKFAWPNQLKLLNPGSKVINEAWAGAGIAGICQRTVKDLLELKKNGRIPDHVIVGLTSHPRLEIYDAEHINFMYEMPLTGQRAAKSAADQPIIQSYLAKYKNIDWAIKYLYTLMMMVNAVYGIVGKYPLLLNCGSLKWLISDIDNFKEHVIHMMKFQDNVYAYNNTFKFLRELVEDSRINSTLPNDIYSYAHTFDKPFCLRNHARHEAHELFAKYINEHLT